MTPRLLSERRPQAGRLACGPSGPRRGVGGRGAAVGGTRPRACATRPAFLRSSAGPFVRFSRRALPARAFKKTRTRRPRFARLVAGDARARSQSPRSPVYRPPGPAPVPLGGFVRRGRVGHQPGHGHLRDGAVGDGRGAGDGRRAGSGYRLGAGHLCGAVTHGGSLANLTGLLTARNVALGTLGAVARARGCATGRLPPWPRLTRRFFVWSDAFLLELARCGSRSCRSPLQRGSIGGDPRPR